MDWQNTDWDLRAPSTQLPDVVPLGHYELNLGTILGDGNQAGSRLARRLGDQLLEPGAQSTDGR